MYAAAVDAFAAEIRDALRDPGDRSPLRTLSPSRATFASGREYPCLEGRPILIDESTSLFRIADIQELTPTTQDHSYSDTRSMKNYIRRRVLPQLTWDREEAARADRLAARVAGRPVLVIGAGNRGDEYRARFPGSRVVLSDVHLQFGADCALDAHQIPFADRTFGLVLASQVLEHTSRPWLVAAEMQRVTQLGGVVHVEVPFGFPYHGAPYDFFRFTPSALRFLFSEASVLELDVTEGRFSSAAVFLSHGLIDSFSGRRARQAALAGARLGLWWLKYLDRGGRSHRFSSPKGLYISLEVDGVVRNERSMLDEVRALLGHG